MAQGGSQLDYHILQDLKQRFPEIPEKVVSQCLLKVRTRCHNRNGMEMGGLQDVNNTGPETLPVSVCNCFLCHM